MDRLDEMVKAAVETFNVKLPPGFNSQPIDEHLKDLRTAFVLGAKWSDDHPYVEDVILLPKDMTTLELKDD